MGNRRKFIQNLALGGIGLSSLKDLSSFSPAWNANNWQDIKAQFNASKADLLNLNSGSAGSMPDSVIEQYIEETTKFNSNPLYFEKASRMEAFQSALSRLASFMDCPSENLVLTKNTTESLNAVIWGLPLKKKDNVIIADADYAYVQTAFKHRSVKEGFTIKRLDFKPAQISDEDIVSTYVRAMDTNTKLVVVSMITPREGQLMPVKEIIKAAHERGIEVLVDGAHTLGQCVVSIRDLKCDYFAGCLHKWMNGPHGLGVLYVKQDHIEKIDPPMFPFPKAHDSMMAKYTYSGTIGFQKIFTLPAVMDFNERISLQKKINRLKHLSQYWQERVKDIPGISIITSADRNIALGCLKIKDKTNYKFLETLRNSHKINIKKTGYIDSPFFRISTNIFIDENDLDTFVKAIEIES